MARNRTIGGIGRTFADQHFWTDKGFATAAAACPRNPQRPAGTQACRQVTAQPTAALHIQRLVDGLVADPHCSIFRKIETQAIGNLLRAPCRRPSSRLPRPVSAALPNCHWPKDLRLAWPRDHASQSFLHISPQCRIGRQLRRLRAPGSPLGMPLRGGCPILQPTTARCRISSKLARDRRRAPPHLSANLPHPAALRAQYCEILPFSQREMTSAPVTSCAVMVLLMDQPTTRRENRSMTTAT